MYIAGYENNASSTLLDQKAETEYGVAYVSDGVRGNVYSLGKIVDDDRLIKFDSLKDEFHVRGKSKVGIFGRTKDLNMYYLKREISNNTYGKVYCITVEEKMMKYTKREREDAEKAYMELIKWGFPSKGQAMEMIRENLIKNISVTARDLERAYDIYDTHIERVRSYATGRTQSICKEEDRISYLLSTEEQTASCDIMNIGGCLMMMSLLKPLGYLQSYFLSGNNRNQLLGAIKIMKILSQAKGYKVTTIRFDREPALMSELTQQELNEIGIQIREGEAGAHVSDIENVQRYVKAKIRTILLYCRRLGYNLPSVLVRYLLKYVCKLYNLSPGSQTKHRKMCAKHAFDGVKLDGAHEFALIFGQLVEISDSTTTKGANDLSSNGERSDPCIALHPMSSWDKSWCFYNIRTGGIITRSSGSWTEVKPDNLVLAAINNLDPHTIKIENISDLHDDEFLGENSQHFGRIFEDRALDDVTEHRNTDTRSENAEDVGDDINFNDNVEPESMDQRVVDSHEGIIKASTNEQIISDPPIETNTVEERLVDQGTITYIPKDQNQNQGVDVETNGNPDDNITVSKNLGDSEIVPSCETLLTNQDGKPDIKKEVPENFEENDVCENVNEDTVPVDNVDKKDLLQATIGENIKSDRREIVNDRKEIIRVDSLKLSFHPKKRLPRKGNKIKKETREEERNVRRKN